jgi:hypothetical protein
MRAAARSGTNLRTLIVLLVVAAVLFFGSILFIISRAQP